MDLDWVYPKAAYNTIGGTHNDISVIMLKSDTEGGNITSNWNDFVGFTSGWGASDVTEYSAEYVVDGYEDYAEVMKKMMYNKNYYVDCKINSNKRYQDVYKLESVIQKYIEIYREVVDV